MTPPKELITNQQTVESRLKEKEMLFLNRIICERYPHVDIKLKYNDRDARILDIIHNKVSQTVLIRIKTDVGHLRIAFNHGVQCFSDILTKEMPKEIES